MNLEGWEDGDGGEGRVTNQVIYLVQSPLLQGGQRGGGEFNQYTYSPNNLLAHVHVFVCASAERMRNTGCYTPRAPKKVDSSSILLVVQRTSGC